MNIVHSVCEGVRVYMFVMVIIFVFTPVKVVACYADQDAVVTQVWEYTV